MNDPGPEGPQNMFKATKFDKAPEAQKHYSPFSANVGMEAVYPVVALTSGPSCELP